MPSASVKKTRRFPPTLVGSLRKFDVNTLPAALQPTYHGDSLTVAKIVAGVDFRLRTVLNLSAQEKSDLVAFLKALTDPKARNLTNLTPLSVPSGLTVD